MKGIRKLAPYLRPYYKTIAVMVILGVFSVLAFVSFAHGSNRGSQLLLPVQVRRR